MSLIGKAICAFKRTHLLKRRKATEAEIYAFMPQTGYPVKMVRYCERCGFVEAVVARVRKAKVEGGGNG